MLDKTRLVILYVALPGYMVACLKTLRQKFDVELLIFHRAASSEAPYKNEDLDSLGRILDRSGQTQAEMLKKITSFKPHAIYVVGWMDNDYLRIARQMRKRNVPVIAGCDRQWSSSIRQRFAQIFSPVYLHTAIDILWVAGARQRQLAARLGYRDEKCWNGVYACDWEKFARISSNRNEHQASFLFVGRYVKAKGINQLVQAYQLYRERSENPWSLFCIGTGPEADLLTEVEGITDIGFVQPAKLPEYMSRSSVLVLPSIHEPWGVVVQEAAASRLALICSDACGAADHLLHAGLNGELVKTGDVDELASAMVRLANKTRSELQQMGEASFELSKQYTPERWASTLIDGLREFNVSASTV